MERAGQKNLVLILARELASNIATPVFIVDTTGRLVYYNEPGADILGQPFAEVGELEADSWGSKWNPRAPDGTPLPVVDLPLVRALQQRRPFHSSLVIDAADGQERTISVTALPLFARLDEFVGAVAFFWEGGG